MYHVQENKTIVINRPFQSQDMSMMVRLMLLSGSVMRRLKPPKVFNLPNTYCRHKMKRLVWYLSILKQLGLLKT